MNEKNQKRIIGVLLAIILTLAIAGILTEPAFTIALISITSIPAVLIFLTWPKS